MSNPISKKSAKQMHLDLPAGYIAVQSGSFAPTHDFVAEPELEGVVTELKEVKKGGKIKNDTAVMTLDTAYGPKSVWRAAQLTVLFDAENIIGKTVYIRYDGDKKIPGQKNPMHLYTCGYKG